MSNIESIINELRDLIIDYAKNVGLDLEETEIELDNLQKMSGMLIDKLKTVDSLDKFDEVHEQILDGMERMELDNVWLFFSDVGPQTEDPEMKNDLLDIIQRLKDC